MASHDTVLLSAPRNLKWIRKESSPDFWSPQSLAFNVNIIKLSLALNIKIIKSRLAFYIHIINFGLKAKVK